MTGQTSPRSTSFGFAVLVSVNPAEVRREVGPSDTRPAAVVVADEITSNLSFVRYVTSVSVEQVSEGVPQ